VQEVSEIIAILGLRDFMIYFKKLKSFFLAPYN